MISARSRSLWPFQYSCGFSWIVVAGFVSLFIVLYGVRWLWSFPHCIGKSLHDLTVLFSSSGLNSMLLDGYGNL